MPINLIRVKTPDSPTAFSDPYYFNVNNSTRINGSGLQDIARVLIAAHVHVDPYLFINGSRTSDSYGSDALDIHGAALKNNLPKQVWTGTSDTGTFGDTNLYTVVGTGDNLDTNNPFKQFLDGIGHFLYYVNSARNSTFGRTGFMSNNTVPADTISPYHLIDSTHYFDHQQYTYVANDAVDYSRDRFGFTPYTFFAGPLYPEGIVLTNDVGGNKTFAEHVADSSIHKTSGPVIVDVDTAVDFHAASHGYLNIYDTSSSQSISVSQGRASDNYPLDSLDNYEGEALEQVDIVSKEITHPVLYEEGIYLWNERKLRQFKTIKADPDDLELAAARASANPLDSLFIGADSFYKFMGKTDVQVIHNHLDSYYYNNYYRRNSNFEYDGDEKFVIALHQNSGLAYQPRRGWICGI